MWRAGAEVQLLAGHAGAVWAVRHCLSSTFHRVFHCLSSTVLRLFHCLSSVFHRPFPPPFLNFSRPSTGARPCLSLASRCHSTLPFLGLPPPVPPSFLDLSLLSAGARAERRGDCDGVRGQDHQALAGRPVRPHAGRPHGRGARCHPHQDTAFAVLGQTCVIPSWLRLASSPQVRALGLVPGIGFMSAANDGTTRCEPAAALGTKEMIISYQITSYQITHQRDDSLRDELCLPALLMFHLFVSLVAQAVVVACSACISSFRRFGRCLLCLYVISSPLWLRRLWSLAGDELATYACHEQVRPQEKAGFLVSETAPSLLYDRKERQAAFLWFEKNAFSSPGSRSTFSTQRLSSPSTWALPFAVCSFLSDHMERLSCV